MRLYSISTFALIYARLHVQKFFQQIAHLFLTYFKLIANVAKKKHVHNGDEISFRSWRLLKFKNLKKETSY